MTRHLKPGPVQLCGSAAFQTDWRYGPGRLSRGQSAKARSIKDRFSRWWKRGPFTRATGTSCACRTTAAGSSAPPIDWEPAVCGPGQMSNPHLMWKEVAFPTNKVVKVILGGMASSGTRSAGKHRKAMKHRLPGATAIGRLMTKAGNLRRAKVPGATLDHQSGGSSLLPAGKAGSGASASGTRRRG